MIITFSKAKINRYNGTDRIYASEVLYIEDGTNKHVFPYFFMPKKYLLLIKISDKIYILYPFTLKVIKYEDYSINNSNKIDNTSMKNGEQLKSNSAVIAKTTPNKQVASSSEVTANATPNKQEESNLETLESKTFKCEYKLYDSEEKKIVTDDLFYINGPSIIKKIDCWCRRICGIDKLRKKQK